MPKLGRDTPLLGRTAMLDGFAQVAVITGPTSAPSLPLNRTTL